MIGVTIAPRVRGEAVRITLTVPTTRVIRKAMLPVLQEMADALVAHGARG